ncbi:MAG: starch-binding protein, partial [Ruminococcus sp.]
YTVTGWGAEYGAKLPGYWGTDEPTSSTVEETTTTVEETSSSVEETSSSVEEISTSATPTTRRVWFRNDHNWSNVRIYAWYTNGTGNVELTPWDDIPTITKDGQDNGKDMYYYDLPVEYTSVIFVSNSKASQTVDITLDDTNNAYYPTDEKDSKGHELVEAFVYNQ